MCPAASRRCRSGFADLHRQPAVTDRGTATRTSCHRFVAMLQVSWQMMMMEFPAAGHVVTGLLPSEDAAAGLAAVRRTLLGRLASLFDMYAIAEIVERDGTHIQCALDSASDAAELADAVGASDSGCNSRWASRRNFQLDDAAAKAIGRALSRYAPAEALPQGGKPLAVA